MSLPAASRHSKLLVRHLLILRNHSTLSSSLKSVATENLSFQQTKEDPLPPPSSVVREIVEIVHNNSYESWKSDDKLNQLLFSNSSPLSSHHLLQITRQLGSFDTALKFMEYFQSNSTSSETDFLSYGYQGVFELAGRESDKEERISELLCDNTAQLSIPLNVGSVAFLIQFFGKAKMVNKSKFVYNAVPSYLRDVCVRNALLEVLLKFGHFKDALNMLDEMLEKSSECPPNDITKDTFFPAMLKIGRKFGDEKIVELVSKFGDHDVFPDVITLTKWITKLYKFGKDNVAWDLLHTVMNSGGRIEAPSCNAILVGLGKAGQYQKMNLLLKEMKEKNITPNVVTFGIFVNYLCKSGRVDEAIEVSEKMRGGVDGIPIKPDAVIYNTIIDGLCKIGRQNEGLKLMDKMRSEDQCAPTAATYNCLIDGFCKAGEIENAYGLFEGMEKEGVPPNIITVNTMIDGMCRLGRVGNAFELFSKMKDKGSEGNAVTYSILIGAFCGVNNVNKAMDLFDEMTKTCEPDAKLFYILITGLSQAGQMDDASRVYSMMKEAGFRPDIACYNVMLSGFCKKKKTDKIYETLRDMEEADFTPDGITYNTLISYFSKSGDLKTAHKVFTKMADDGYVPTVVTYGALIHGFCTVGDLEEAMDIFMAMSSTSRVPPNTVIYNTLIDSLCKKKKIEDALYLLDDMKVKGVRPATNTFNPIFQVLMEMNWLDKAFELMDQMTENACVPDAVTMDYLTKWLPGVGATGKMKSFIEGYRVCTSI